MSAAFDLWIECGRRYCPGRGWLGRGGVGVLDGCIAGFDWRPARRTVRIPDGLLLPGLVDLHAHPDRPRPGVSRWGVVPDRWFLRRGVTTVLSQGDSGAAGWEEYRRRVVDGSRCDVRMALNIRRTGEARGTAPRSDGSDLDAAACAAAILAERERPSPSIWGIAVNTSPASCGDTDPRLALDRALQAARATDVPLLVGTRRAPDLALDEQMAALRPGDVVTYCFHARPEGILDGSGRVRHCVRQARERGVLFDLGHGTGSFSYAVAERAVEQGFLPDTLSTDFHRGHLRAEPGHSLPGVISRLLTCGARLEDLLPRVTEHPRRILGCAGGAGRLEIGNAADLVILRRGAPAGLPDGTGEVRRLRPLVAAGVVRRGRFSAGEAGLAALDGPTARLAN